MWTLVKLANSTWYSFSFKQLALAVKWLKNNSNLQPPSRYSAAVVSFVLSMMGSALRLLRARGCAWGPEGPRVSPMRSIFMYEHEAQSLRNATRESPCQRTLYMFSECFAKIQIFDLRFRKLREKKNLFEIWHVCLYVDSGKSKYLWHEKNSIDFKSQSPIKIFRHL